MIGNMECMILNLFDSPTYVKDLDTAVDHTVNIGKLRNSSVLITGATGTIGSFIADMLLRYNNTSDANITVYAAGFDKKELEERFLPIGGGKVVPVHYNMYDPIEFDVHADYIIHAAGNAHPAAFSSDPVGTIVGNMTGTYNMLEYGRSHGAKRMLYVSSGEVYGQGDLELEEFEESYAGYIDPTSPRSCYPSSKRAAENLCASYSKQYGMETVIVRPCHTYGPGITVTDSRANVQFVRNVLNGEDIVMKSAGTQLRSYNYIADCASAILSVLINGASGEAYNIANRDSRVTIAGLAQIIANAAGRRVVFADPDAVDLANRTPIAKQVLSSKKIEALGWTGAYTAELGTAHMLAILQGK